MTDEQLSTDIDKAVEEYLALKVRVTALMGEVGEKAESFEYPKSLYWIACSMVLVDQCVAEQAPVHFIEHLNNKFAVLVDGCRESCGEPKPLDPDDPDTWPELLTEVGQ